MFWSGPLVAPMIEAILGAFENLAFSPPDMFQGFETDYMEQV